MPRGYSESGPMLAALAGDFNPKDGVKPPVRTVSPSGWESDNIAKLLAIFYWLRALDAGDRAEIKFWTGWWRQVVAAEQTYGFCFDEWFSRIYTAWHIETALVAEALARICGDQDLARKLQSYLLAAVGYLGWSTNGSRPREVLDHGDANRPEPVYADGDPIKSHGPQVTLTGKRSWARGDDEDPDKDRDDDLLTVEANGLGEFLGVQLGEGVVAQVEVCKIYQRLDALCSRRAVAPAWRLSPPDRAAVVTATRGDLGALEVLAEWCTPWPIHGEATISRTEAGGVWTHVPHVSKGSTGGGSAVGQWPTGRCVFVSPLDGRRGIGHAVAVDSAIRDLSEMERRVRSVRAGDGHAVEAPLPEGRIVATLAAGPGRVTAWTARPKPKPPEPPPGPKKEKKKGGLGCLLLFWLWFAAFAWALL